MTIAPSLYYQFYLSQYLPLIDFTLSSILGFFDLFTNNSASITYKNRYMLWSLATKYIYKKYIMHIEILDIVGLESLLTIIRSGLALHA